jgi:SAM-dependent methyltransferase
MLVERERSTCTEIVRQIVDRGGPDATEYSTLNELLGVAYRTGSAESVAVEIRNSLADVTSADTMQGFALRKPHGYAGDFEMIDRIYGRHVCSDDRYAKWDLFFHAQAAPAAVRNRKTYFHLLLDGLSEHTPTARVLKVGSGPGRSMYEWMSRNSEAGLSFDCVEIDAKAIEYAQRLNKPHANRVRFFRKNALRYRPTTTYELIWSAGLFDYFDDRIFMSLLSRLLGAVKPGGELVIGNFAEGNPSQGYMELVGDWRLQHRSAEALLELAIRSGVDKDSVRIGWEPLGVNLFLHIQA